MLSTDGCDRDGGTWEFPAPGTANGWSMPRVWDTLVTIGGGMGFRGSATFRGPSMRVRPDTNSMRPRFADSPEFERLLLGASDVHLARIALEIASDAYPELDVEQYLARIAELSQRVRDRCRPEAKVHQIISQINWVLFVEEEFQGNQADYYDARNSYLNEVLDRRLGIPISLSVLYWTIAEQLGLPIVGVNLPLHFMLRIEDAGRTWFVDPFHAGAVYDRKNCERLLSKLAREPVTLVESRTAPCPIPIVVSRILKNLRSIYWDTQDLASVLPIQRRLAALNPREPSEQRDLGLLCSQLGRLGAAIDPLQDYLDRAPTALDAEEIGALLQALRQQVARWN
jgi:regulator of sirC expression with transglutaminase-like and TPR domain